MRQKLVPKVSLERALSKLGYASRTVARSCILEGRVQVNGRVVQLPDFRVDLNRAKIAVDGTLLEDLKSLVLILHKPKGLVTTARDEKGRKTVFDCFKDYPQWQKVKLSPVGRLDQMTSGLLVFTNHNRLSDWLLDPKNEICKRYVVRVRGAWTKDDTDACERGVLEGGERLQAKSIEITKTSNRESQLLVELTEGKNREIRRMMKVLNHEVQSLKRIELGQWTLMDPKTKQELKPGQMREVLPEEFLNWIPPSVLKKPT